MWHRKSTTLCATLRHFSVEICSGEPPERLLLPSVGVSGELIRIDIRVNKNYE